MKQLIFAGIVTYNPDLNRLQENIDAILPQVQELIVVDNGSDNVSSVEFLLEKKYKKVVFIKNKTNKGIATALNFIMSEAEKKNANWVLTLDQDTVVYDSLVDMYMAAIQEFDCTDDNLHITEIVASFSCLRRDRNFKEENRNGGTVDSVFYGVADDKKRKGLYSEVETCITSGNLVSVAAWRDVGGFDDRLFIDMVDDEFCFRLREHGYSIIRVNEYGFLHELGDNLKKIKILGKNKTIFIYGEMRKYYVARNIIYLVRRYKLGKNNLYIRYLKKRMLGTLLYEKHRFKGLFAYMRGIFDGKKMEITK